MPAGDGRLTCEAVGEIEEEGGVLIIRRIHVTYHLKTDQESREIAERVHSFHAKDCPLARTIGKCVAISTSLEMEDTIL